MVEECERSDEEVQPPRKKLRALRRAGNAISGRECRGPQSSIQTLRSDSGILLESIVFALIGILFGLQDSLAWASLSNAQEPVAGGPDALSLKRYELWKSGLVCDFDIICSDGIVIKATRLELAVWSESVRAQLLSASDAEKSEMEIAQADSEIVATLVQSLYEKEITVTALNAHLLLALADRLRIPPILEVVERYLISQINHENAVEALLMAEKHNCMLLRQAAIPLTATNFDRIDPKQLTLLTANDMQELLASDQLSSTEEHTLFAIVKQWSKGQDHGFHSAETEQAILRLVKEIRLEHIGSEKLSTILDDPWLQQHPLVLSAVAKALITKKDLSSPSTRTNRVGQVVRFSDWSLKRTEALDSQSQGQTRQPIYSPNFNLQLPGQESIEAHVQVYPGGFSKYPDKIGIFLAGIQGKENQNPLQQKFRITIVNQHNHKDSVTAEFKQPTSSTGGTLKFWGSQQFISAAILEKGFLVDDTLTISIVPMTNDASQKMMSPSPLRRQALSERESSA